VSTLERLRAERDQVQALLKGGHVLPSARPSLEQLLQDLNQQIDRELTLRLSHSSSGSKAAD
jgi:hypothetical protein